MGQSAPDRTDGELATVRSLGSAEEDTAAAVIPPLVFDQDDDVVHVEVLGGNRLRVRFHDGVEGVVDLTKRIQDPAALFYAPLADPGTFAQVGIAMGTVTWPGEIDLPPDAMHDAIARTGEWSPG